MAIPGHTWKEYKELVTNQYSALKNLTGDEIFQDDEDFIGDCSNNVLSGVIQWYQNQLIIQYDQPTPCVHADWDEVETPIFSGIQCKTCYSYVETHHCVWRSAYYDYEGIPF